MRVLCAREKTFIYITITRANCTSALRNTTPSAHPYCNIPTSRRGLFCFFFAPRLFRPFSICFLYAPCICNAMQCNGPHRCNAFSARSSWRSMRLIDRILSRTQCILALSASHRALYGYWNTHCPLFLFFFFLTLCLQCSRFICFSLNFFSCMQRLSSGLT